MAHVHPCTTGKSYLATVSCLNVCIQEYCIMYRSYDLCEIIQFTWNTCTVLCFSEQKNQVHLSLHSYMYICKEIERVLLVI